MVLEFISFFFFEDVEIDEPADEYGRRARAGLL